jgi:hypothetical protein
MSVTWYVPAFGKVKVGVYKELVSSTDPDRPKSQALELIPEEEFPNVTVKPLHSYPSSMSMDAKGSGNITISEVYEALQYSFFASILIGIVPDVLNVTPITFFVVAEVTEACGPKFQA